MVNKFIKMNNFFSNPITKHFKRYMWIYTLIAFTSAVVNTALIWFSGVIMSIVIAQNSVDIATIPTFQQLNLNSVVNLETDLALLSLITVFLITNFTLQIARITYMNVLGRRLYLLLLNSIFVSFSKLRYSHFTNSSPEYYRVLILSEVQEFVNNIFKPFLELLSSGLILFSLTITLSLIISPGLMIATLIVSIIFAILFILCKKVTRTAGRQRLENNSLRYSLFEAFVSNYKYIKFIGRQNYFVQQFYNYSWKVATAFEKINFFSQLPSILIQNFALGLIVVGAIILFSPDQTPSDLMLEVSVVAFATLRMLPEFSKISVSISIFQANIQLIEKVRNALVSVERDLRIDQEVRSKFISEQFRILKFNDVDFHYDPGKHSVIRKLSFEVKLGDHLIILGKTGTGKSTIVDMLLGLVSPTNGEIFLNEHEYKFLTLEHLHKLIAYVPQQITLFDESVIANITMNFNGDCDFELLKLAISISKCDDFVNLDDERSYNKNIGANGALLSGGQRQRLAIARAIYSGASVIVFDEAFNALDETTKIDVRNALHKHGKFTIIEVSHDLLNLPEYAKILCLGQDFSYDFGKLKDVKERALLSGLLRHN